MSEFLDKLKRGIDKGVTTVTVKSKEALETTQLRSQVKTLQEEKQRGLEELGNIVYTLYVQGTLETEAGRVRVKCSALAALDQKIRDKEDEIRQVQLKAQEALGKTPASPLGVCACGAPIYEGMNFCGGCGKNVDDILSGARTDAPIAKNRCPQCGTDIVPEACFCGHCGTKVEAESTLGQGLVERRGQ
jgi:NADH pyrophosphatase NudC (nudix superfamily)